MPTRSHPQPPAVTAAQAGTRPGPSDAQRGVPWWGVVPSAAAPVLLVGGWTIAARLQPGSFDPVTSTVSTLASDGAADRWVMTLAFLVAGACEVMTGLALRPAASAGRLILIAGGMAGILVAASPEPAAPGSSTRHLIAAVIGLVALAVWPGMAGRRGPSAPWGLRPAVCAGVSAALLGLLLWFGTELVTGGGQVGLAERVLGGMQVLWPLLAVLSCRSRRARARPPTADGPASETRHEATRAGGPCVPCGQRS
jgi:Protein of unknown function (DUF998)